MSGALTRRDPEDHRPDVLSAPRPRGDAANWVTRGAGSSQHLASVLQEGRESANIDAGLGFIWRISAKSYMSVQGRSRCLSTKVRHPLSALLSLQSDEQSVLQREAVS